MTDLLKFIEFNQYNFPLLLQCLALYFVLLWLAVVAWVLRDITTRTNNLLVVFGAAFFVLVGNLPALILYLLIRPDKTIDEGKDRDLFYASVLDKEITACGHCGSLVRSEFKFCPNCSFSLQHNCPSCNILLNPTWRYCVNCNYSLAVAPWYKRWAGKFSNFRAKVSRPKLSNIQLPNISRPQISIKLPALNLQKLKLKRVNVNLEGLKAFVNINRFQNTKVKTIAAKKHSSEISTRKTIAQVVRSSKKAAKPAKVAKSTPVKASKPTKTAVKSSEVAAKVAAPKKRGRGRPAGTGDKKPRKPRADAGKKRGKYNKA